MTIRLEPIPAFSDNYIWLLINDDTAAAIIVDPGDASGCIGYLESQRITPAGILVTHHHWDHTGGINELVNTYHIPVYGPANENIAGVTIPVSGNDRFTIEKLDLDFEVLDLPGHTSGHVGYLTRGILFCGDTLFSAGCGRLFEGTAAQLHASLERIAELPDDTLICCAHEYTLDNLRFASAVEPENPAITQREDEVRKLRQQNTPSLPSKLVEEKAYNPFLRISADTVRQAVASHSGIEITDSEDCFRFLRMWKDGF